MRVGGWVGQCKWWCPQGSEEGIGSFKTGLTDCELPDTSAGNQTLVLWQSSTHCQALSHLYSPHSIAVNGDFHLSPPAMNFSLKLWGENEALLLSATFDENSREKLAGQFRAGISKQAFPRLVLDNLLCLTQKLRGSSSVHVIATVLFWRRPGILEMSRSMDSCSGCLCFLSIYIVIQREQIPVSYARPCTSWTLEHALVTFLLLW